MLRQLLAPRSARLVIAATALVALASPAAAQDTDGDGIDDAVELAGVPGEPLLDFPAYGADPGVPDIFVQADWQTCDPILEYCGPNNSFDQHQLSSSAAARLAAYFAPDFALHIDNGVAATDPARATLHGHWGGATRLPVGSHPCYPELLGARHGAFHRGVTTTIGSGGGGDLFGFCFGGDAVRMGVLAQELGHNFGINHGGNPPSYPANCKPHYRSPMNYAFTYDSTVKQFSRGAFTPIVLNPTRMDEELGLGTADPDVRAYLSYSPWDYLVRDDGAVDWNRNGRIDPDPVRAATTWAWASCEQSVEHSDFFEVSREPALAWLPLASAPRLYLISRRPDEGGEGGALIARYNTRFDRCVLTSLEACTEWSPQSSDPARPVPGARPGAGGVAAAGWTDAAGVAHLGVAYAGDHGKPFFQVLTVGGDGAESWSAPQSVADLALGGEPALALDPAGAKLVLLAPVSGRLLRWEYDLAAGTWSEARDESWLDGAPLETCAGAGLARGFGRSLVGGERLFAAVSRAPDCTLELAVHDAQAGAWLPVGSWLTVAPFTDGRPALAYVPYDRALPEDGRFYLAWRPYPTGAGVISLSQGNDVDPAAPDRRLVFPRGTYIRNLWALLEGTVTLAYDVRYDDNLRAAWVYANSGAVQFQPFADGILDVDMRDQDDYGYILDNLACSLDGSCEP